MQLILCGCAGVCKQADQQNILQQYISPRDYYHVPIRNTKRAQIIASIPQRILDLEMLPK